MSKDRTTDAHRAMAQLFKNPDPRSLGVMDFIFDVYPLFYRKIFKNNKLMERVVMTGLNGMDILDYFVCGRCESIAPQSGTVLKDGVFVPQCTCTADGCGATTVNPPTLREWLMYELRKKAPPGFETILSMAMNNIAQTYLRKALKDYKQAEGFPDHAGRETSRYAGHETFAGNGAGKTESRALRRNADRRRT